MGLIKAGIESVGTVLSDQWKEFFYCDSLENDVLVCKAQRRYSENSSNYGQENIISHGGKFVVNAGQCLILVEDGKIFDFCAEPGAYIYSSDTEPSLFEGGWKGLKDSLLKMGKRFTYGGQTETDQRAYYVNMKEITGNKFGIGDVPFRDAEFGFSMMLKGYGLYSFRIENPILFYTNLAGNSVDRFVRSQIEPQLKAEFQQALQVAIGKLSSLQISYDQIPFHTKQLAEEVDQMLDTDWKKTRGIVSISIGFASLTPTEECAKKVAQFQESRVYTNQSMLGARMGLAQASAMEKAASNANGAMNGFIGMGFAQQAGGTGVNQFIAATQKPKEWICKNCGNHASGKFCSNCGKEHIEE